MKRSRWSSFRIYLRYAGIYLHYAYSRFILFLYPDELNRYLLDGWFYDQIGLVDRVIEALKKILSIQPNNFFVRWNLACAYLEKGQQAEGLLECRKALGISPPEYGELGYVITPVYPDREAQNIALGLIQKVIKLDPEFGGAYEHLGYFHVYREEWGKASEMFEKAIALGVTSSHAYLNLGYAYEKKGYGREALQKYREAVHRASNPNFIKEINSRIRELEKNRL